MTVISHILGFPRIGLNRELKITIENFWLKKINKKQLKETGYILRKNNWNKQKNTGICLLPVGDFAWYDHVLNTSLMLNNIPERHKNKNDINDIDTIFYVSRGNHPNNKSTTASKMTKWFNTNYHYIIPEFTYKQSFKLNWNQLTEEIDEAIYLNYQNKIKPILLGPITYLWLGKIKEKKFNRLSLLPKILKIYQKIFKKLNKQNITWVQFDEPILILELPKEWCDIYYYVFNFLKKQKIKILLTTYFDSITHNINLINKLKIQGIHIDLTSNNDNDINNIHNELEKNLVLSAGIINGKNIWRTNLKFWFNQIIQLIDKRKIWLGSSCSLLHSPIDINVETSINKETKNILSFSIQKCYELNLLCKALNQPKNKQIKNMLEQYSLPIIQKNNFNLINKQKIEKHIQKIKETNIERSDNYITRSKLQKKRFNLPSWPTTTIGSFPQTNEIRYLRNRFKQNKINIDSYNYEIKKHIKKIIKEQEKLDLDVLVHGEIERNDMVEYFGENLNGFILTQNGWVQSYGTRCVKPPIIISDISRYKNITVEFTSYAQSLTKKPVKGMLTGPVTILLWSFVREDINKEIIIQQIALALREEVKDLENSGIGIIQIDEPALREGLPLKISNRKKYLELAIKSFNLITSITRPNTQIHTHICYSEFNDIMNAIINLDVDVITIEASKSEMDILKNFKQNNFPSEIGPGIYDIHSPNIPSIKHIIYLLEKAKIYISPEKLWVNPDCGLKTRQWSEINKSLKNMVTAAKIMRKNKRK